MNLPPDKKNHSEASLYLLGLTEKKCQLSIFVQILDI